MEEIENEKLLREIKPKFNYIYELLMPTGRKMKSALIMSVISVIITIIISVNKSSLSDFSYNVVANISLMDILMYFCYFMIIFSILKLVIHIVFQKMQYEHISYKFYETYMVYEDDFLNQHKKNILYSNVKEVEIRRTIWDRITGFGVIVIYTNAENKRNNGLVVYALNNPKEDYEFVDKLINRYRVSNENKKENIEISKAEEVSIKTISDTYSEEEQKIEIKTEDKKEEVNILQEDLEKEQREESFKDSLKETK